jgi:hypothetical protein
MPQYFIQAAATAPVGTVAISGCKVLPVFAIAKADSSLEFCNEQVRTPTRARSVSPWLLNRRISD